MKTTIKSLVLSGLLLTAFPAAAGAHYEQVRAWIAESIEWRLSFLPKVYQAVDVFDTDPAAQMNPWRGAATLTRTRNGFSGSIMSHVAEAGAPYTLWAMVINNPGACSTTPCSLEDLFEGMVPRPEPELSIYNGGGEISASNGDMVGGGVVKIDFETTAGPLPDGLFDLLETGVGLQRGNGFHAEVWLIIDSHDPLLDDSGSLVRDLTETDGNPTRNHRIAFFPAE